MAKNPPYTLKNTTKDTFLFSVNHDDNVVDHVVIKGGSYIVFNESPTEGHVMTDLEKEKLTNEIFRNVGQGFTLSDKDGAQLTSNQFLVDNPPTVITEGNQAAISSGKDVEESIWTNGTNYYIRRSVFDSSNSTYTISYVNPDGTTANPDLTKIYPFAKDVDNPPLTYTSVSGSPFTLTTNWTKVVTTSALTKGLRISPLASASTFDIEWISVPAGSAAPTDTVGEAILGGEDFSGGIPVGDIYLKSASGQKAIVKVGV